MKTIFLGIIILIGTEALCQPEKDCSFLSHVKFKNGTDTLTIRAVIKEMGRWSKNSSILLKLESQSKLREKDFLYAIGFQLKSCTDYYYIPSRDTGQTAISLFEAETIGSSILLRIIVFEDLYYNNHRFFFVDKIWLDEN